MYTHVTHRRDSLSDTRYSFVMTTKASIYRVDRNCLLLFDTAIQEQNEMFLPNIWTYKTKYSYAVLVYLLISLPFVN